MRKLSFTHLVPHVAFAILTTVVLATMLGCASTAAAPGATSSPKPAPNEPEVESPGEYAELNEVMTWLLAEYMNEYGLGASADEYEIATSDIYPMDFGSGTQGQAYIGRFQLLHSGEIAAAYSVSTVGIGQTAEEALRMSVDTAVSAIGSTLIAYLPRDGFDYETDRMGGYGFYLTTISALDGDERLLRNFTRDLRATASAILRAAEPALIDRFGQTWDTLDPREPAGILQFTLMGTDISASGSVEVSVIFDDSGQIASALTQAIDWPDIRGMYAIAMGYAKR